MKTLIARLEKPMSGVGIAVRIASIGLIVGLSLAFCVQALGARDADTGTVQARESLREHAGAILADVFSVDARTWTADRETARSLVAPPLSVASARALAGPPPDGAASVDWTPQNVAVTWADDTDGETLVVVRVTITARSGHTESALKSVQAAFTRVEGRWLLNGLEDLQ